MSDISIRKYVYGNPFDTEAVVEAIPAYTGAMYSFINMNAACTEFTVVLSPEDIVYGLGENMGGINKRGRRYVSNCTDDPHHTEDRESLYCAHNFIVIDGSVNAGIFIDYPATVTYDIGFTDKDELKVTIDSADYVMYVITGDTAIEITNTFRKIIGRSYVAPKWAFGYQQSRWGYKSKDDIREVVARYKELDIPLSAVYMDIDYMDHYKDFTVNEETFSDLKDFVDEMMKQGIHLVPAIDAGVKIEDGYDVYEEGVKNNYFCKDEDGKDFVAAVWPGKVHMPDFLNPETRKWFGYKYKRFTDIGIDAFWNDMNEPALFYSEKHLKEVFDSIEKYKDHDMDLLELWGFQGEVSGLANNPKDYASFYHNTPSGVVRHDKVHNLYGYNMTRSAAEAFAEYAPDKEFLLFSRSSSIGMHRYGGMWTGDNSSWWSHIELLMHMLPGLNMCGFLYVGADVGGFGGNVDEELLTRFLELSLFTPLMRNHSSHDTRRQELYRFKDIEAFRNLINLRYALIPYLYESYMKAADNNTMMFTPLGMMYPDDREARHVEDQLFVGEKMMIAPVYQPHAIGRSVYLPEAMTMYRVKSPTDYVSSELSRGHHYVECALNEVLIFVKN